MLLAVLGIILLVDAALYINDPPATWRGALFGLAATLASALFAWWPAAAASSLLLIALAQLNDAQDGSGFLYVTGAAGLVVYTSPTWFIVIYIVAAAGLTILTTVAVGVFEGAALPTLGLVIVLSAAIGWALRSARRRELRLAADLAQLSYERSSAVEGERERIADELHDIIAHDVTLVSMHARVLERVDDPALRRQSVEAIRSSADQALADIRRVLQIVRDGQSESVQISDDQRTNVSAALDEAHESLSRLGARISVRSTPITVSAAIEQALVHVIREGTTNIAKHAAERPTVAIVLETVGDGIRLEMRNSQSGPPKSSDLPSSGYGLDRLRERVSLLGGELTAVHGSESWTLTARLPVR